LLTLRADVPRKLAPLLPPKRYKGAYGGRGGAKSHFFAEELILRCYERETRAVCIREVQNSIKDSVHQLLSDKIRSLGLEHWFEVLEREIRCSNGSFIIFRGMQEYNADNIKSLEGFDIAWVEEAQSISERSWRMLRPTLRNPGSEIWCSWNPRHKFDPVDQFFRSPQAKEDQDIISVEVGWEDNPWLPDELLKEKNRDYAADPIMAAHVWGGGYEVVAKGAYYAKEMVDAEQGKRICNVPYEPKVRVTTGWDLGIDDCTSIWFAQIVGQEIHIIDFYENSGVGLDHYAKILAQKPYVYEKHLLPHDSEVRELGTGRSRIETLLSLGVRGTVVPIQSVEDGINAVRIMLPKCWFDKEKCEKGVDALRLYRKEFDDKRMTFKERPLHDWTSHAADAFRYLAWGLKPDQTKSKPLKYPKARIV